MMFGVGWLFVLRCCFVLLFYQFLFVEICCVFTGFVWKKYAAPANFSFCAVPTST